MMRLVPVVLVTAAFVAFGWSNFRRVSLNLVVAETESPLIFLMLIAFAAGAMVVVVHSMMRDAERRLIERKLRDSLRERRTVEDELDVEVEVA